MQEITVALSVERVVGGAVKAGQHGRCGATLEHQSARSERLRLPETQFIFHGMLVTRVTPGNALPTAGQPSDSDEVQTFDIIMVTLAATTPQVEKIVYGAEQQEDGNGGIWLTLEPENADQSGSERRTGENILP